MSDLASDLNFILQEETKFRSALSEPFIQKISAAINFLIDVRTQDYRLGDYIHAMLTQSDVDAIVGVNKFVIPSGQSIAGSDLDTTYGISTLPDLRGSFVRGLDNGAGVDSGRTMASSQSAQLKAHFHRLINNDPNNDIYSEWTPSAPFTGTTTYSTTVVPQQIADIPAAKAADIANLNTVESEVGSLRPKNLAVNIFVRINN